MTASPSPRLGLPDPRALGVFLGDLLGRAVRVKKLAAAPPRVVTAASYAATTGAARFVWACDLPAAVHLAASLSMYAPSVAEVAVKRGELSADLIENMREVFNVAARLFEGHETRVRLAVAAFTETSVAELLRPRARAEQAFEIDVAGFGSGRVAFRDVS